MTRQTSAILMLLMPTLGCNGSIITVNIGAVTRQAATTGPRMAPEVLCTALLSDSVKMKRLSIEAQNACTEKETKPDTKPEAKK